MRMTQVDVSRLSYAELVALRKQLDHQIDEKRGEELKVLVDGFAKKLEAGGSLLRRVLRHSHPI